MKKFNGKAIYCPSGKAQEYSYWACNFYVGCSNCCTYCYCKKGILKGAMGMDMPQLKKCFKDKDHALEIFEQELLKNLADLQKCGLFFSFTTDPLLFETKELTMLAVNICLYHSVPVKILSKCTEYVGQFSYELQCSDYDLSKVAFGFTLTGHDELEPNANTNNERIQAMKRLHDVGFKTFASIEPIIDFASSFKMINQTHDFCDLYKVGLESGKKYDVNEVNEFIAFSMIHALNNDSKIYFKDSILKASKFSREILQDEFKCVVNRDYNLFQ